MSIIFLDYVYKYLWLHSQYIINNGLAKCVSRDKLKNKQHFCKQCTSIHLTTSLLSRPRVRNNQIPLLSSPLIHISSNSLNTSIHKLRSLRGEFSSYREIQDSLNSRWWHFQNSPIPSCNVLITVMSLGHQSENSTIILHSKTWSRILNVHLLLFNRCDFIIDYPNLNIS